MGTSSSRTNPGGSSWVATGRKLANRSNAVETADSVLKVVLPVLPDGSVKAPLYVCTSEIVKFGLKVKKKGFEEATKDYVAGKTGSTAGSAIGQGIWNTATSQYGEPTSDPTVNNILSNALKQTLSVIGKKGVKAYARE